MEGVHEELDTAKAVIEKLSAEYRVKAELSENLRKAHNEQAIKIQDLSSKLEKQAQELMEKADEISVMRQRYGDVNQNMKEKETIIRGLSAANDRLRVDSHEKLKRCEDDNRGLIFSLDEANVKNVDQENKIRVLEEEIEGIKGMLSLSRKKCSEAENWAKASKELRQREDMLLKFEEENRKVEDQLKWKKEQFKHLEEAHEKLKDKLQAREKEWERERSTLLDEISTLHTNLDSQTRIAAELQSRLQICNQALAHEESRRRYLEVQLSESKTCFDNVFAECEEAKLNLESLTGHRDKEIATLRDSLGTKETLCKEMKYSIGKLEQDNQELKLSLKEHYEAHIQEAGTSSLMPKLHNKLRALEQIHADCSAKFKGKEAERSLQMEKVRDQMNCCRSELESKDAEIKELRMEVEDCNSLVEQLALWNEESSVMLLVLKSEFMEAQLKFADEKANLDMKLKGLEKIHGNCLTRLKAKEAERSFPMEKVIDELNCCRSGLESKDANIKELRMEAEYCSSLVEQLALQNEESSLMLLMLKSEFTEAQLKLTDEKAELDRKQMEKEEHVSFLMKQLEMKNAALFEAQVTLAEEHEKVASLLEKVETLHLNEQQQLLMQAELHRGKEEMLKEEVLQLKIELRKVNDALSRANDELAQKCFEESEAEFELQIWKSVAERLNASLEQSHQMRREVEDSLLAQVTVEVTLNQRRESLVRVLEEKDGTIGCLQQRLVSLDQQLKGNDLQKERDLAEQEWVRRELEGAVQAQIDAESIHEHEKKSLHQLLEEKNERIYDLQEEIDLLHEAWEEIKIAVFLKEFDIQEKTLMIVESENSLSYLQQKLELQEKTVFSSIKEGAKIEAELEAEQFETRLSNSDALIRELDYDRRSTIEDVMKLSSERDNLFCIIEGLSDRTENFCIEDIQLMSSLGKMVQSFGDYEMGICLKKDDELFDPSKENMEIHSSPVIKKVETILGDRSPFRTLNN
ncbi:hypothetical protein RJ639_014385 [Escallonia herrerae]|uniref:Uncharacterized protein n=1 Tax=Escallonia herrerae TaxID=1293975 RepID=A0AA88VP61_9ASTE|nr:hypothetical protein RJ639_014385 [Escallonia herrerae]